MNSTLFENFDERAQEVRNYFLFLKNLEHGSIQLTIVNTKNRRTQKITVLSHFRRLVDNILKMTY
jgi:hypothetical protein